MPKLSSHNENALWQFLSGENSRQARKRCQLIGLSWSSFRRYRDLENPIERLRYGQLKRLIHLHETRGVTS